MASDQTPLVGTEQNPLYVPPDTPAEAINKIQRSLEIRIDQVNKNLVQIGKELHELSRSIQKVTKK